MTSEKRTIIRQRTMGEVAETLRREGNLAAALAVESEVLALEGEVGGEHHGVPAVGVSARKRRRRWREFFGRLFGRRTEATR
jgi:predicted urease superfamily metal-dependent hydrolase